MDRLETPAAHSSGIEAALRRDRLIAVVGLVAVVALAWVYLWNSAAAMDHAAMGMMAMPYAMGPGARMLTFVMWTVMMVGMMLPSAAPTILFYGALVRKNGALGRVLPGVSIFAGAYLVVWTAFSAVATLLQAGLEHASLLNSTMAAADARLGALLLVGAGVYQATPVKRVCLSKCRNPVEFFMTRWRGGAGGAFRMGLEHGAYCVGCCWVLMLLLFVAGVMNLLWVALIAAFVFVEKVFAAGPIASRAMSAVLIVSGLYLLVQHWN